MKPPRPRAPPLQAIPASLPPHPPPPPALAAQAAPAAPHVLDLLVRRGGVARAGPQRPPVASRGAALRDQAAVAPDPAQAGVVVGPLHHAADALPRVGADGLRAVDIA